MVREEEQWKRCSWYSKYHRTLAKHCYAIDIDMIEWRQGRGIIGFFEIKHEGDPVTAFQLKVLHELAQHYPVYLVRVQNKETRAARFSVSIVSEQDVVLLADFDQAQYRRWIESL